MEKKNNYRSGPLNSGVLEIGYLGISANTQLAIKAGHYRPISKTPFEWRFVSGPIVARDSVLAGKHVF